MKGSVDIRYMIDVGVKGGVLVMRRRIHTSERIDKPAGQAGERPDRFGYIVTFIHEQRHFDRADHIRRPHSIVR